MISCHAFLVHLGGNMSENGQWHMAWMQKEEWTRRDLNCIKMSIMPQYMSEAVILVRWIWNYLQLSTGRDLCYVLVFQTQWQSYKRLAKIMVLVKSQSHTNCSLLVDTRVEMKGMCHCSHFLLVWLFLLSIMLSPWHFTIDLDQICMGEGQSWRWWWGFLQVLDLNSECNHVRQKCAVRRRQWSIENKLKCWWSQY